MKKKDLIDFWFKLKLDSKDIELIILKINVFSRSQLFLIEEIEDNYIEKIKKDFIRLQKWEPIQYILQEAEFMWNKFFVDNRALIPRDDTEILVSQVIQYIKNKRQEDLLLIDIWTGSWIIPISIFSNLENIKIGFAVDVSKDALDIAEKNVKDYWLQDKIKLINSNLLEYFLNKLDLISQNSQIIITANLPYIKNNDFHNMDKSTINFEPNLALYWWEKTGFELYEKLINQCLELKNKWKIISLFIEIWFDQYKYSKFYLEKLWLKFKYFKDTNNIYRCISIFFDN